MKNETSNLHDQENFGWRHGDVSRRDFGKSVATAALAPSSAIEMVAQSLPAAVYYPLNLTAPIGLNLAAVSQCFNHVMDTGDWFPGDAFTSLLTGDTTSITGADIFEKINTSLLAGDETTVISLVCSMTEINYMEHELYCSIAHTPANSLVGQYLQREYRLMEERLADDEHGDERFSHSIAFTEEEQNRIYETLVSHNHNPADGAAHSDILHSLIQALATNMVDNKNNKKLKSTQSLHRNPEQECHAITQFLSDRCQQEMARVGHDDSFIHSRLAMLENAVKTGFKTGLHTAYRHGPDYFKEKQEVAGESPHQRRLALLKSLYPRDSYYQQLDSEQLTQERSR